MRALRDARFGISVMALAAFSGCGSGAYQMQQPGSAYAYDVLSSTLRPINGAAQTYDRSGSWVAPDAKSGALLYVSSGMTHNVNIYSYPGAQLKGKLTGFNPPQGLCSDAKGDVFIPEEINNDIIEYAHGGTTPIAKITDPNEDPVACSVDPTTGTLAVANITGARGGGGSISLYANATGSPQIVHSGNIVLYYECGYDDAGNLFADGLTNLPSLNGKFAFAEMPKGTSTFTSITIDRTIAIPGGVQWDGKYMAVGDAKSGTIYRTDGATGKVESTVKLIHASDDFQPWIQGNTVVALSFYSIHAGFAHYPAGGKEYKTIKIGSPFGATVSVAPQPVRSRK